MTLQSESVRVSVAPLRGDAWSWFVIQAGDDVCPDEALLGMGTAPDRVSAWADAASVVNNIGGGHCERDGCKLPA